jgi:hypothetical protein
LFTGYSVPVDADKGGQHFTQVTADLDREQDLFSQALAAKAPPVDSLELV